MLATVPVLLTSKWLPYYTYPFDGPLGFWSTCYFSVLSPLSLRKYTEGEGDGDLVPRAQNSSRSRNREASLEALAVSR